MNVLSCFNRNNVTSNRLQPSEFRLTIYKLKSQSVQLKPFAYFLIHFFLSEIHKKIQFPKLDGSIFWLLLLIQNADTCFLIKRTVLYT